MATAPHKIKLTYFDGPGRAEPIRLAFFIGGIAFEDERLTREQFAEQKAAGRFKNGQVPVLEVDGVQFAQSRALLQYAGQLAGLYPSDPIDALKATEIMMDLDDLATAFMPAVFGPESQREEAFKAAAEGPLTAWLKRIDARLGANKSGYYFGNSLTIVDLLARAVFSYLDKSRIPFLPEGFLNEFRHILHNLTLVNHHPKIIQWNRDHSSVKYPVLKLTYFQFGGRAEPIRLAFHLGGVPFEDERLSFPEFGAAKAAGRFKNGSMPVLEIDGVQHAQSNALLEYAGTIAGHGLTPTDPLQALKVTEVLNSVEDVFGIVFGTLREQDQDKKTAAQAALVSETGAVTAWLKRFDSQLAKNGTGHSVSNHLTVADLKLFNLLNVLTSGFIGGIPNTVVDSYEHLSKFHKHLHSLPKIAEYFASQSQ